MSILYQRTFALTGFYTSGSFGAIYQPRQTAAQKRAARVKSLKAKNAKLAKEASLLKEEVSSLKNIIGA